MAQRQGDQAALDMELPPTSQGRAHDHNPGTGYNDDNETLVNHHPRHLPHDHHHSPNNNGRTHHNGRTNNNGGSPNDDRGTHHHDNRWRRRLTAELRFFLSLGRSPAEMSRHETKGALEIWCLESGIRSMPGTKLPGPGLAMQWQ